MSAHQHASTLAWRDESHVQENRMRYRDKFAAVTKILQPYYDLEQPEGGFYHWMRTPIDDLSFSQRLLRKVRYYRGDAWHIFGRIPGEDAPYTNPGQGHVRVAWVAGMEDCVIAAERLSRVRAVSKSLQNIAHRRASSNSRNTHGRLWSL